VQPKVQKKPWIWLRLRFH